MTQEQEELLLKDLCARLPYGVILNCCEIVNEPLTRITYKGLVNDDYDIDEVKPYLFPLSSMTEEEQKEYRKICDLDMTILENCPMKGEPFPAMYNSQDWLDKNHFDYRGLIEKGLAIDATGKNIY